MLYFRYQVIQFSTSCYCPSFYYSAADVVSVIVVSTVVTAVVAVDVNVVVVVTAVVVTGFFMPILCKIVLITKSLKVEAISNCFDFLTFTKRVRTLCSDNIYKRMKEPKKYKVPLSRLIYILLLNKTRCLAIRQSWNEFFGQCFKLLIRLLHKQKLCLKKSFILNDSKENLSFFSYHCELTKPKLTKKEIEKSHESRWSVKVKGLKLRIVFSPYFFQSWSNFQCCPSMLR